VRFEAETSLGGNEASEEGVETSVLTFGEEVRTGDDEARRGGAARR
jgi:chromosome condensin MukBEF MukE localization factor